METGFDEETKKLDACMVDVIKVFEKNRVFPSGDNITQLTDTLFKAKRWKKL